jgi:addiction module HigA family antidote
MIARDHSRLPADPVHPGEVLLEEFLKPLGITQTQLAAHLRCSIQRVNEIIKGKRSVTAETAWQLSATFGTTPQLWLNLQATYDLVHARPRHRVGRIRRAG